MFDRRRLSPEYPEYADVNTILSNNIESHSDRAVQVVDEYGWQDVVSPWRFAQACTRRGLKVLPCHRNKQPATDHGFHDASTDPDQVHEWFADKTWDDVLVATLAGAWFTVIDCDGQAAVDEFLRRTPEAVDWPSVSTPRGMHFYVQAIQSGGSRFTKVVDIPNKEGKDGIDILDGGYVIVGGAQRGEFLPILDKLDKLSKMPDYLIQAVKSRRKKEELDFYIPPELAPTDQLKIGKERWIQALETIRQTVHGGRHDVLYHQGRVIGNLIARGLLDTEPGAAINELAGASVLSGHGRYDALRTAGDGVRIGMASGARQAQVWTAPARNNKDASSCKPAKIPSKAEYAALEQAARAGLSDVRQQLADDHDPRKVSKDLKTRKFPRRATAHQPAIKITEAPTGLGKTEEIIKLGRDGGKALVLSSTGDAQNEIDTRAEAMGIKNNVSFKGRRPVNENMPDLPGGCFESGLVTAVGEQEHAPGEVLCHKCKYGYARQVLEYHDARNNDEAMMEVWNKLEEAIGGNILMPEVREMACHYLPQIEAALKSPFVTAQVTAFTSQLLGWQSAMQKEDKIVCVDETPDPFRIVRISPDKLRDLCEKLEILYPNGITRHLRSIQKIITDVSTSIISVPDEIVSHCEAIYDLLTPDEQRKIYNVAGLYTAYWEEPTINFDDPDKSDIPLRDLQTLLWCGMEGWLGIHRQELVCQIPTLLTIMGMNGQADVNYFSATPNQNLTAMVGEAGVIKIKLDNFTSISWLPNISFFKGDYRHRTITINRQARQIKALLDAALMDGDDAYVLTHKDLATFLRKKYPDLKDRFLWWGRHDKALDAYKGCHLIICGLPIPPPLEMADMYCQHARILRHQGIEWPEWDDLEWINDTEVQMGNAQGVSCLRVPEHLGARKWYLTYYSQQVVQAIGRVRGQDGRSGKITLATPFVPLPEEYKNVTIAGERPAALGMTRHEYNTVRHDSGKGRCMAAYTNPDKPPTYRETNKWLVAHNMPKVRHSIWSEIRELTDEQRRQERAEIKKRCRRWTALGRCKGILSVIYTGHRLETAGAAIPETAISIPTKPPAVRGRATRAPPVSQQVA